MMNCFQKLIQTLVILGGFGFQNMIFLHFITWPNFWPGDIFKLMYYCGNTSCKIKCGNPSFDRAWNVAHDHTTYIRSPDTF